MCQEQAAFVTLPSTPVIVFSIGESAPSSGDLTQPDWLGFLSPCLFLLGRILRPVLNGHGTIWLNVHALYNRDSSVLTRKGWRNLTTVYGRTSCL